MCACANMYTRHLSYVVLYTYVYTRASYIYTGVSRFGRTHVHVYILSLLISGSSACLYTPVYMYDNATFFFRDTVETHSKSLQVNLQNSNIPVQKIYGMQQIPI